MTTEASSEDKEQTTRPRDWKPQLRRRGLDDGPEEYTTTMEALAEEDEHKDFNNYNRGVSGG